MISGLLRRHLASIQMFFLSARNSKNLAKRGRDDGWRILKYSGHPLCYERVPCLAQGNVAAGGAVHYGPVAACFPNRPAHLVCKKVEQLGRSRYKPEPFF